MRSFFFFFLFSLFLFTFHSATGNIIYETCRTASRENQNVNYNFCKTSLLAIPAAQRSNLQKLGLASINLLEKNIASTMADIKKVLKKKALNKNVKKYSTTCLDIFTQTLDDLKDTVDNYKSKNFYEVNQDIIEISRAAKVCDDGFAYVGVVSPLKKSNDNTSQLATIALKIIDLYTKAN